MTVAERFVWASGEVEVTPGSVGKDFTTTSPITLAPCDLDTGHRAPPRRRRRRRRVEKSEPRFPGWRYDRDLVAHYTAQLTALDEQAIPQIVGSLVAQGVVKAAGERYRRMAELALAAWYRKLREVLHNLWTEAWHLGRRAGESLATAGPVDWGAWTPGDPHAAALLTEGDTALQRWLEHYGVQTIRSIAQTRYNELADVLADALEHGAGVDELGRRIRDQLDVKPSRARMIAATEVARAVSQATLQSYRDSGLVDMVEWSSADDARVCKICDANEGHGPVPVGGTFPSGQDAPPAHPMCRCAPIPAFDLLEGLGPYDQPVGKAGAPGTADTPGDVAIAERGREYWEHGGGAARIRWGTQGDFERCVEQVVEHARMTPERARGYCNLRHHGALGYYPATHAAMERGHKYADLRAEGLVKIQDEAARTTADDVYALLAETYPGRVLGWVREAEWTGPRDVPLSTIDLDRRPGGRDPAKVRGIERQLAEHGPKSFEPVVLVDTPDADEFAIADGYHRALAFQHAGESDVRAYVGTVGTEDGPWDRAMHDAKLNKAADSAKSSV